MHVNYKHYWANCFATVGLLSMPAKVFLSHIQCSMQIPLLSGCKEDVLVQKAIGLDLKRLKLNPKKINCLDISVYLEF